MGSRSRFGVVNKIVLEGIKAYRLVVSIELGEFANFFGDVSRNDAATTHEMAL